MQIRPVLLQRLSVRVSIPYLLTLILAVSTGCDSGVASKMQPNEVFRWCDGGPSVSFGAPPAPWQRSKHQERDTGVAFVFSAVPPGLITIGQFNALCSHDSRMQLRELYDRFEELSAGEFRSVSHHATRFQDTGYTYAADDMIINVNDALREAQLAHGQKNYDEAFAYVEAALVEAESFEYELDDLLEHFQFDPEEFNDPERFTVQALVNGTLDSLPSATINYTMTEERGLHHGRKVYVEWDNHLFVFSYLGPEKYLKTFETMLATVSFPEDE